MKKTLKVFVSLLLILTMVLGGATFVFADTADGDAVVTAAPTNTSPVPTVQNGYNVMIDGSYVNFADALPQNINGRIMVPFRAIFEAMGAKVDYEKATKTVIADKDDVHISFAIGSKEITVKKGSDVTKKSMDVPAFIDTKTSRTFVPTRFVAEALGYSVGWDNSEKTAVIIDLGSIIEKAESDFSFLFKALEGSGSTDMTATYKTTGDMSFVIDAEGDEESEALNMGAKLSFDGITKGLDAQMSMKITLDLADMHKDATPEEAAMLATLKDLSIDVKINGESGDMWFKCDTLNQFVGVTGDNVWFKMNIFDLYDSMGIDLQALLSGMQSGSVTSAELLTQLLSDDSLDIYTYATISNFYEVAKVVAGNDAFSVKKSGNTANYSLTVDKSTVTRLCQEVLKMAKEDTAEIVDLFDALNLKVSAKVTGEKVSESTIVGKVASEGMEVSFDIYASETKAKISMSMNIPEVMNFKFDSNATTKQVSDKIDNKLPAGATVIDLMESLGK